MAVIRPRSIVGPIAILLSLGVFAEEIPNWAVAPFWSPPASSDSGLGKAAVPTFPIPFVGINPCRIADTRGNGFTGAFGPPPLVAGASAQLPDRRAVRHPGKRPGRLAQPHGNQYRRPGVHPDLSAGGAQHPAFPR